jgi:hypothetical protein
VHSTKMAAPHSLWPRRTGLHTAGSVLGLEVPSSNLGAPIEKRPCGEGLFQRQETEAAPALNVALSSEMSLVEDSRV